MTQQSMIDRLSPPVFHQCLQYAAAVCWKRPHAHVSLDRRSIGPGSCVIPFYLALRVGDRGDGAAWRSHRRDWASGVVGHMRFLAQGEERVAALELSSILIGWALLSAEDPISRRWALAHLMRWATPKPIIHR
jgi:hypothetical protein